MTVPENSIEVKLERIKWVCLAELEKADIEAMVDISTTAAFARDLITVRVHGHVWGEGIDKRTIRHPLNWIEAVKERWMPYWSWMRRRWPVRYKVHHIEARVYYPGIRPSLPNHEWRIAAYVRNEPDPYDGRLPEDYD